MDKNTTTLSEHKFLVSAATDFGTYGKTNKKCPRCGNNIILEDCGSAYTVRCKTSDCIRADFRGI